MKKIAAFLGAMAVTTAGFCGVGSSSGTTTCHVYKANKLLKTVKCAYESASGASSSYAFSEATYKIPGFGTMSTSTSVDGFTSDGRPTGSTTTVNDEPAVLRYRLPKNKQVVSQAYADSGKEVLECYLSKKSGWEICS